jgi:casein kinase 1 epsilon
MKNVQAFIIVDIGIPKIHWCGTEGDYHILVMELLGPSLENMFELYNKKFSLKCSIHLVEQMVVYCLIVDYLH